MTIWMILSTIILMKNKLKTLIKINKFLIKKFLKKENQLLDQKILIWLFYYLIRFYRPNLK
jgi:hypothetical protein